MQSYFIMLYTMTYTVDLEKMGIATASLDG